MVVRYLQNKQLVKNVCTRHKRSILIKIHQQRSNQNIYLFTSSSLSCRSTSIELAASSSAPRKGYMSSRGGETIFPSGNCFARDRGSNSCSGSRTTSTSEG